MFYAFLTLNCFCTMIFLTVCTFLIFFLLCLPDIIYLTSLDFIFLVNLSAFTSSLPHHPPCHILMLPCLLSCFPLPSLPCTPPCLPALPHHTRSGLACTRIVDDCACLLLVSLALVHLVDKVARELATLLNSLLS